MTSKPARARTKKFQMSTKFADIYLPCHARIRARNDDEASQSRGAVWPGFGADFIIITTVMLREAVRDFQSVVV